MCWDIEKEPWFKRAEDLWEPSPLPPASKAQTGARSGRHKGGFECHYRRVLTPPLVALLITGSWCPQQAWGSEAHTNFSQLGHSKKAEVWKSQGTVRMFYPLPSKVQISHRVVLGCRKQAVVLFHLSLFLLFKICHILFWFSSFWPCSFSYFLLKILSYFFFIFW